MLIYATLFGIGKLIFKEWTAGGICIAVAVVAAALISRNLSQADWSESRIERCSSRIHLTSVWILARAASPLTSGSNSAQLPRRCDHVVKMWPTRRSST